MEWHGGIHPMQEGSGAWYANGTYPNYSPYSCPPPVVPPPTAMSTPPPAWGQYPPPYASYPYPPTSWPGYGPPPPGVNVPPPSTADVSPKAKELNAANPPLPKEPPPSEPPLPPKEPNADKSKPVETKPSTPQVPILDFDPKAPPPPPPPEENKNAAKSSMPNAMNYHQRFQGGNWYNNSMYMKNSPGNNSYGAGSNNSNTNNFVSSGNNNYGGVKTNTGMPENSKKCPIKFNLAMNNRFDQNAFDKEQNRFGANKQDGNIGGYDKDQNKHVVNRGEKFYEQKWPPPNNFYNSNNANKQAINKPANNAQGKKVLNQNSSANLFDSAAEWPDSLKAYVGKCFARCVTEIDKDQVEICLKGKLTAAVRNGSLWDKKWDDEPLIGVYSTNTITTSPKKPQFGNKNFNKVPSPSNKIVDGDPSRGFYVTRRDRSRSRSRSASPARLRRDRRYSSEPEERDFISFRGGARGGKGKRNRRKKNNNNNNANMNEQQQKSSFYSKSGMVLEPELCTSDRLNKRAARFGDAVRGGKNAGPAKKRKTMDLTTSINQAFTIDNNSENIDWISMHISGTSTALEKQYLRLTSAPDPSTVRTVATLKRSLEHVKKQWKTRHNYKFTCDQLKSIRQDLTVQGIRDQFTRDVYETHCRVALEKGDHEEFNQCQSQLKDLYGQIGGDYQLEFTAYRLLYYIYTSNTLDMTSMLASLSETDKKDECVSFSLKLRAAWSLKNYYQFFKLYRGAPKMTGFLVDWFVERERKTAIKVMTKSYRPGNLDVEFVKSTLAFSEEDWVKFSESLSLVFTDRTKNLIDCKATAAVFAAA